ncbi:biopolymer transporter ExbD [Hyphococcus flavus]|uniref:Biopolymer transporter ExbD n=1 Tax=Hyphococcus flavus TaxID=1866326 RepID=A0AAF0CHT6_9PROT|nr:biopolymer transporter ExbD [Hyphococcus flavus]WDI32247.1 biopolymer transporter ExbD [Hyphococcus flavus]
MRKKAIHSDDSADVNITPLLDIVFILLIFFIVTATFLREQGIDVNVPEDNEETDSVPPPAILLAVQEDGFVRVNNVRVIDPGSVTPVVQEFYAREPQGVVLVSAAPESESGVVVEVMDQARDGCNSGCPVTLALQKAQQ